MVGPFRQLTSWLYLSTDIPTAHLFSFFKMTRSFLGLSLCLPDLLLYHSLDLLDLAFDLFHLIICQLADSFANIALDPIGLPFHFIVTHDRWTQRGINKECGAYVEGG